MLAETRAAIEGSLFVVGDSALAAGIPATATDLELLPDYVVDADAIEALADLAWENAAPHHVRLDRRPAFLEDIGFEPTGKAKDNVVELTAELEAPVREVVIGADGIRLGQLLKLAELVDTGAEAKALLAEEAVEVNGEVELRRGRQMADGDEVRTRDQAVRVRVSPR